MVGAEFDEGVHPAKGHPRGKGDEIVAPDEGLHVSAETRGAGWKLTRRERVSGDASLSPLTTTNKHVVIAILPNSRTMRVVCAQAGKWPVEARSYHATHRVTIDETQRSR